MISDSVALRWKDNPAIYPEPDVIAKALNDPGQSVERTRNGKTEPGYKYDLMDKLATHIYNKIKEIYKSSGLTVNVSRGKQKLATDILLTRKHTDLSDALPFFHKYGKDGKVFLTKNDEKICGLDICVEHFQEQHEIQNNQKNMSRTSNDGLRLAMIMLDPHYRQGVSGYLSKSRKKNRPRSDQTSDPNYWHSAS